jgi:hypothetical protein
MIYPRFLFVSFTNCLYVSVFLKGKISKIILHLVTEATFLRCFCLRLRERTSQMVCPFSKGAKKNKQNCNGSAHKRNRKRIHFEITCRMCPLKSCPLQEDVQDALYLLSYNCHGRNDISHTTLKRVYVVESTSYKIVYFRNE